MFCETGSVLDKRRERLRSVLTPEVVEDIRASVTRSPHKSLRRLSREKNKDIPQRTAGKRTITFSPHCCKKNTEMVSIPNAGFP